MLERQLRHLVRLIDDLMDVSRIAHDRLVLQPAPVVVADTVRQAADGCRHRFEAAAQRLELELPAAPIGLQADPARLEQILHNLLDSASKFSPARSRVTLRVQRRGDEVEVSVRDRGAGIAADMVPRLFEMFSQDGARRDLAAGGLGVGLALSRRLAELHGGSLRAHSAGPGLGSVFALRLPVDAGFSATLASAASRDTTGRGTTLGSGPAAAAASGGSVGSADAPLGGSSGAGSESTNVDTGPGGAPPPCRVLIVEDNHDAAASLSDLLRLNGHEVCSAHDGRDALPLAHAFEPDALLLDIGLPGLSGLQVARQVRAQPWGARLLLVAMTGWGQDSDRRASAEAGFDAHLVKPIDPEQLLRLLAQPRRPQSP